MRASVRAGRVAGVFSAVAVLAFHPGAASGHPLLKDALHPSFKGTVGLCILVDPAGSVVDVQLIEPSGNPNLDQSVTSWARSLEFTPVNADRNNHWLAMYASFEGSPERAGQPDCSRLSRETGGETIAGLSRR